MTTKHRSHKKKRQVVKNQIKGAVFPSLTFIWKINAILETDIETISVV